MISGGYARLLFFNSIRLDIIAPKYKATTRNNKDLIPNKSDNGCSIEPKQAPSKLAASAALTFLVCKKALLNKIPLKKRGRQAISAVKI